jgi:transcriptional regulator with XRE-family HTH domain
LIDITTTFAVISWKKRRKMLGFTQEELAELMCVTPVQISHYENDKNDKNDIKVSVLRELARCLRVSTTYLLDGEIECFDKDVMQIAIVLQGIESEELRNVALEQLKVLVRVADLRNLRNR